MKRAYKIKVGSYGIRPVTISDAQFIIEVRNANAALGNIHDTPTDINKQKEWITEYINRDNDYYFIVTDNNISCGTVGLYNLTSEEGEWGRWVVPENPAAAIASAVMICEFGFNILGIKKIYGYVVEYNKRVLNIHRKFGMQEVGVINNATNIGGKSVNYVRYELLYDKWPQIKCRNMKLLQVIVGNLDIACY